MEKILNWLFHGSEKSYQLFSEYETFSGRIFLKNGEVIDLENASIHFRGDYVIFEALFAEPDMTYNRLTIDMDDIVRIKN